MSSKKPDKIKVTLRIYQETKQRIENKAIQLGISENDVMSIAINTYIKNNT